MNGDAEDVDSVSHPLAAPLPHSARCNLAALPDELIFEILTFLPVHSLASVFLASSNFSRFATYEPFWRFLFTHQCESQMMANPKSNLARFSDFLTSHTEEETSSFSFRDRVRFFHSLKFLDVDFFEEEAASPLPSLPTAKFVLLGEMNVGKTSLVRRYFDPYMWWHPGDNVVGTSFEMTRFEDGISSLSINLDLCRTWATAGRATSSSGGGGEKEGEGEEVEVEVEVEDRFGSNCPFPSRGVVEMNIAEPFAVHVWDTAGQERYKSLAPMYYRGASGHMVVFDLSRRETLQRAMAWIKEIQRQGGSSSGWRRREKEKRGSVLVRNGRTRLIALVGNKSDLVMGEEKGKSIVSRDSPSCVQPEEIAALVRDVLLSPHYECEIEYFETSCTTNDGVGEAFDWLFARAAESWFSEEARERRKGLVRLKQERRSQMGEEEDEEFEENAFVLRKSRGRKKRCILS